MLYLTDAHMCARIVPVNGTELLRKLRKLAKDDGVSVIFDGNHGKGSHGRL